MDRRSRLWIAGVGVLALSGCASFEGMPAPVHPPSTMVDLASGDVYGFANALQRSLGADDDAKRHYRDTVVAIQMAAIDARYGDFRARLSRQAKLANFGLDLGVQALTSAGAIAAERTANILSAGGAGLSGAKGSLNKEVYFEKTLPALLISMDARRTVLKARMIEKMRRPIADYSIAEAIADLSAYQLSASLDSAIGTITADAVETKQAAEETYDRVSKTCNAEEDVGIEWARIGSALDGIADGDEVTLDKVSTIVGSDKNLSFDDQKEAIKDQIGLSHCSIASARALIEEIRGKAGVMIP